MKSFKLVLIFINKCMKSEKKICMYVCMYVHLCGPVGQRGETLDMHRQVTTTTLSYQPQV